MKKTHVPTPPETRKISFGGRKFQINFGHGKKGKSQFYVYIYILLINKIKLRNQLKNPLEIIETRYKLFKHNKFSVINREGERREKKIYILAWGRPTVGG